jgi:predicted DNA-binding transcriptional regulator AlpA
MMARNKTTDAQIESVLRSGIDPFVRISFVIAATGLSRSTIYRLIASGKFPQPSPSYYVY